MRPRTLDLVRHSKLAAAPVAPALTGTLRALLAHGDRRPNDTDLPTCESTRCPDRRSARAVADAD